MMLAAASPEFEVCGLLVGRDYVDQIIPANNVALDPSRNFEIDPAILFAVIRSERSCGAKLQGYYHSHPTGRPIPSPTDAAHAAADGRIWLIIAQEQSAAWLFDVDGAFTAIPIQLIA